MGQHEELEGYVVDQACLRKYPQDELLSRAKEHTRECALMGHCVESGYGLVTDEGRPLLLEPASTPAVVDAIRQSERETGIRLRARRELEEGQEGQEGQEGHMRTVSVEEV